MMTYFSLLRLAAFLMLLGSLNEMIKAQCTIDAGSDLFICVDKFGDVDTTVVNTSFNGNNSLNFRWKCEYWYAGQTKFTASDFMNDTTVLQAKISKIDVVDNEDEIVFILEAYNSSGVVQCSDSMVVTFSEFGVILVQTTVQINQGDSTQITAVSGGGIGSLEYSWTPDYNISDSTVATPTVWPDTTTTYYCSVIDSVGCVSTYDDQWEVIVNPVSVKELSQEKIELEVHPNPFEQNSTIKTNLKQQYQYQYRITDVNGELVQSGQLEPELVIGSSIRRSGLYFFTVYSNGEILITKKIVKK